MYIHMHHIYMVETMSLYQNLQFQYIIGLVLAFFSFIFVTPFSFLEKSGSCYLQYVYLFGKFSSKCLTFSPMPLLPPITTPALSTQSPTWAAFPSSPYSDAVFTLHGHWFCIELGRHWPCPFHPLLPDPTNGFWTEKGRTDYLTLIIYC